jgi:hypothetical protein
VEGKLAADELAMIHGIPEAWIEVTLGHVTRTAQGAGRVLPLDAGGWYAFHRYEHPYDVAPGFAAAWKKARGLDSSQQGAYLRAITNAVLAEPADVKARILARMRGVNAQWGM